MLLGLSRFRHSGSQGDQALKERLYLKGNEALAIGALKAGLNAYFAYPITPASEIPETLAREFGSAEYPKFKVFLQSASEIEAVNMVLGAAATGDKAMTATSSPGFSLKQEAISYAAGMELPCVVVDICRGGPGLGDIGPEQGDYNQAVKGGGHGDYHMVVLAPNSVQEMALFPHLAFRLAFKYRNPVIILGDAFLGQFKEDIEFPHLEEEEYDKSWAVLGARNGERHIINSLHLEYEEQEKHERHLQEKFSRIRQNEVRYETFLTEGADIILVAYGIVSRICKSLAKKARSAGQKVGVLRPITLWPFPYDAAANLAGEGVKFLTVELNAGQMVDDVKIGVNGKSEVHHYGRLGGMVPSEKEIMERMEGMRG